MSGCPSCGAGGPRHGRLYEADFWGYSCDPTNAGRDLAAGADAVEDITDAAAHFAIVEEMCDELGLWIIGRLEVPKLAVVLESQLGRVAAWQKLRKEIGVLAGQHWTRCGGVGCSCPELGQLDEAAGVARDAQFTDLRQLLAYARRRDCTIDGNPVGCGKGRPQIVAALLGDHELFTAAEVAECWEAAEYLAS